MLDFLKLGCKWIWKNDSDETNQYVRFYKKFEITDIRNCDLLICADTDFSVRVNGHLVDFGGYNAFPNKKYYEKLDIVKYVHCGFNELIIDVYYQGVDSFGYIKGKAGLIFAICADNQVIVNNNVMCSDSTDYKNGEIYLVSEQIGPSFLYNAQDFSEEIFKLSAVELDFSKMHPEILYPRPIKRLNRENFVEGQLITQGNFVYENSDMTPAEYMQNCFMAYRKKDDIFSDNTVKVSNNGVYLIFDMGKEYAGNLEFDIYAERGAILDIAVGEHLKDLRVMSHTFDDKNFAVRYIAKEGQNKFTSYFRRTAGRYLQVNISNCRNCTINKIGLRRAIYPLDKFVPIKIEDSLCKKIDEVAIHTLINCMHEHYEDSPWREQAMYASDSRIQALCGYYAFENYEYAKACIDILADSVRGDGHICITAPNSLDFVIPSFTYEWIIWMCEHIEYTNHLEVAVEYYPLIKDVIMAHISKISDGLLKNDKGNQYWHFYDWAEGLDGTSSKDEFSSDFYEEYDVIANLLFYRALQKTVSIAKTFDLDDTAELKITMERLSKNINEEFYDNENKVYNTFTKKSRLKNVCELAQALAIICDLAPNKKELAQKLADDCDMTPVSLSRTIHKYDALLQFEDMRKWVLEDIKEKWGKMLFEGATSFYETEEGAKAFGGTGSLCHGWSATPVYVFRKYF